MGKKKARKIQRQIVAARPAGAPDAPSAFAQALRVWPIVAPVIALASLVIAALTLYYNWSLWQKPDLTMSLRVREIEPHAEGTQLVQFEVGTENRAETTAGQFYWHLNIPEASVISAEMQVSDRRAQPVKSIVHGTRTLHFEGNVKEPLHNGGMIFTSSTWY